MAKQQETQSLNFQKALTIPLENHEIQWMAAQSGLNKDGKPWVKCLAYMNARGVQRRFDNVFGVENWQVSMSPVQFGQIAVSPEKMDDKCFFSLSRCLEKLAGFTCRIACRINGEWIYKEASAQATQVEGIKGAESDAMKRCASLWGVGRYLYDLGDTFSPEVCVGARPGNTARWSYAKTKAKDGGFVNFYWRWPDMPEMMLPTPEELEFLRAVEESNFVWGASREIKSEDK